MPESIMPPHNHRTTRTSEPITLYLNGWRCTCGASERPKYAVQDVADDARAHLDQVS